MIYQSSKGNFHSINFLVPGLLILFILDFNFAHSPAKVFLYEMSTSLMEIPGSWRDLLLMFLREEEGERQRMKY